MGAVSGSGAAFGVLLGGVLTGAFSRGLIFFVNVPVGVAAILLTPTLIPESHGHLGHRRFDVAGTATVTASLTLVTYGIVKASDYGWGSTRTLATLAIALVGAGKAQDVAWTGGFQRSFWICLVFRVPQERDEPALAAVD
jgi:MFS family permease